jgi:hypothetical protein
MVHSNLNRTAQSEAAASKAQATKRKIPHFKNKKGILADAFVKIRSSFAQGKQKRI